MHVYNLLKPLHIPIVQSELFRKQNKQQKYHLDHLLIHSALMIVEIGLNFQDNLIFYFVEYLLNKIVSLFLMGNLSYHLRTLLLLSIF